MGEARAKSTLYLGKPYILKYQGKIETPGEYQVLINKTITENKSYRMYQAFVSCAFEGHWRVKLNDEVVGSGRTGPANKDSFFYFIPYLPIKKDDVIILEYCSRSGIPLNSVSIEAYIQSGEI